MHCTARQQQHCQQQQQLQQQLAQRRHRALAPLVIRLVLLHPEHGACAALPPFPLMRPTRAAAEHQSATCRPGALPSDAAGLQQQRLVATKSAVLCCSPVILFHKTLIDAQCHIWPQDADRHPRMATGNTIPLMCRIEHIMDIVQVALLIERLARK